MKGLTASEPLIFITFNSLLRFNGSYSATGGMPVLYNHFQFSFEIQQLFSGTLVIYFVAFADFQFSFEIQQIGLYGGLNGLFGFLSILI